MIYAPSVVASPIAARSPWQNGYVERVIGSIPRECLDHIIVTGEQQLRRIMQSYLDYYNRARTHLALRKDHPRADGLSAAGSSDQSAFLVGCTTDMLESSFW